MGSRVSTSLRLFGYRCWHCGAWVTLDHACESEEPLGPTEVPESAWLAPYADEDLVELAALRV